MFFRKSFFLLPPGVARVRFDPLKAWIKKFRYEIIALALSAYGMYLRFALLAKRQFWTDEVWSLHVLQEPFKPFWQRFNYTDFTYFPGEYMINWPFVFLFKSNKWGVLIPHMIFAFLSFYLLYLICKRHLHSVFAWIATFALMAAHRELIFHQLELRAYAVLPALSLAAFYFWEEIILKKYSLTRPRKILILFTFTFITVFHIYGAFILFFSLVYFVLSESGQRSFKDILMRNFRFLAVIVLIGLPLYLWYAVGSPQVYKNSGYLAYTFEYIPNPAENLLGFIKTNLCNLVGAKRLYPLGIFLLVPFILPLRQRLQQIGFLLVLIVLPIMVIFYPNLLMGYHVLQRQYTWAMPLMAFLIGWCLDGLIGFIREAKK